jgi:hypothetical protein
LTTYNNDSCWYWSIISGGDIVSIWWISATSRILSYKAIVSGDKPASNRRFSNSISCLWTNLWLCVGVASGNVIRNGILEYLCERRGTSYKDFDVTLCHCKVGSISTELDLTSFDLLILLKELSIILIVDFDVNCWE